MKKMKAEKRAAKVNVFIFYFFQRTGERNGCGNCQTMVSYNDAEYIIIYHATSIHHTHD